MTEPRIIALFDDYAGLLAASRARLAEIGMTYETLDQVIGWGDTRSTKYLAPPPTEKPEPGKRFTHRHLSPRAFEDLVKGIAVRLAFVHDETQLARIKRHRDFKIRERPIRDVSINASIPEKPWLITSANASQMGLLRAQKITQKKRRAIARKAARARWRGNRPKAAEIT